MTDLVRYRRWFFTIAGVYILPSLLLVLMPLLPVIGSAWGSSFRAGIDFTGGTAMTVEFDDPITAIQIRQVLEGAGQPGAVVQSTGGNNFFIRVGELEQEVVDTEGNVVSPGDRQEIDQALGSLSPVQVHSFDAVSPVVGAETVRGAIIAVIVASVAALLYITWAFRRVQNPLRYGAVTVVALVHDVVAVLGVFALLGKTVNMEVNTMFITGVLTVIGYSVNDSIVVLDRVRENLLRHPGSTMPEMVNLSIRETIGRSLVTSLTTLLIIVTLLLFGGPTIQPLLLVLLVGVALGSYSSIFIAGFLLVSWETGELGRFLRRLTFAGTRRRQPSAR